MNLLLDTCALLALAGKTAELPKKAKSVLASAANVHVSLVTLWEIAIIYKAGKLELERTPEDWFGKSLTTFQIGELDLSASLICQAADLPLIHRDPFDRILVATALSRDLTIVTADRIIPTYPGVKTAW